MNKFNRFILYSAIAMFLYLAVHFTLVSAYPAIEKPQVAVIDSSSYFPDTTLSDSLMMVDTTPEVITNEQIISGGTETQLPQDGQSRTTIVRKSSSHEEAPSKSKTTITSGSKAEPKTAVSQAAAEKNKTTIVQRKETRQNSTEGAAGTGRTEVVRKKTDTATSGAGKYKVMAGTYLVRENAEKMVVRLRSMGYTQASVLPKETMFSVVAGTYDSESLAREVSEELKRKQIDSFVKNQ